MKHPINETLSVFKECRHRAVDPNDRSLLRQQIDALKSIKSALGDSTRMKYKIVSFEKLISAPWINDRLIFDRTYTAWNTFRESFASEVGAMTVNERLWFLGLSDDYDESHNSPTSMRAVLHAALLSEDNIEAIIQKEFV